MVYQEVIFRTHSREEVPAVGEMRGAVDLQIANTELGPIWWMGTAFVHPSHMDLALPILRVTGLV